MAIRVIIERKAIPGNELELNRLFWEMRSKAMNHKGYISGETLRSLEDSNALIAISTWNSLEEWKAWEADPERKEIQARIDALLRAPSTYKVYLHF